MGGTLILQILTSYFHCDTVFHTKQKRFSDQRNTDGIERKVNKSLNRNKETLIYSTLMIIFSLTEKVTARKSKARWFFFLLKNYVSKFYRKKKLS